MTPWDWQQIARLCSSKQNSNVIAMETADFKNFNDLFEASTAPYYSNKKTEDNDKFLISKVVHMKIKAESPGVLYFKTDFGMEEFNSIDFNVRRKRNAALPENLNPLRKGQKPISTSKYTHLQKLLKWVPARFHSYYQNLPHSNNVKEEN